MNLLLLFKSTSKPLAWPFFSPVWGEEGMWDQLEAAERPVQMHGAGGSAKLLAEAAEIMEGRKGKQGQS